MASRKKSKTTDRSRPTVAKIPSMRQPAVKLTGVDNDVLRGDDLFPWPWRPTTTMAEIISAPSMVRATDSSVSTVEAVCRALIQSLLGTIHLPATQSAELYLIRAIDKVTTATGAEVDAVVFQPEFLFVLDVGFPAGAGVSFPWDPVGFGDPGFPDAKRARCVSAYGRSAGSLLYPNIAGQLLIGLVPETAADLAIRELSRAGLKNVVVHGHIATAECKPFHEQLECRRVVASLPGVVRFAEPNHVVRSVDVPWILIRLF